MMTSNSDINRKTSFLQGILLVIKRFGQDLLGILFICIGIISVLNAYNLTRGKLIDQWVELIFRWFGLGAYFLIIILTLTGMVILLRHLERFPRFDYTKLLNLEVLLFSFSALLSVIGKFSVERANDGLDVITYINNEKDMTATPAAITSLIALRNNRNPSIY